MLKMLPASLRPIDVFRKICDKPHSLFLDSALQHEELGRYSYVSADPIAFIRIGETKRDALSALEQQLSRYRSPTVEGLPPFQGGIAGLLSYDLAQSLERIPAARYDEFCVPPLAMGVYDVVIAFDHRQNKSWIVSHGFSPDADPDDADSRYAVALQRAKQFSEWMRAEAHLKQRLTEQRVTLIESNPV